MAAKGARPSHLKAVKDMIDGAEVVPPIAAVGADDPVPAASSPAGRYAGDDRASAGPRSGRRRRVDEPELPMLPEDCPVIPLGLRGQAYYFLDELGQLISLAADKVAQKGILSMFGRRAEMLREVWPRYAKDGETINGWKVDVVSELLMGAAAREGVFNPIGKVRGRGAWLAEDGALILHCGDKILVGGAIDPPGDGEDARLPRWHAPGKLGAHVYPTGETIPRPSVETADTTSAEQLLALLGAWRWSRPIDAVLLLGWIGAALVGGALRWRPMVWITGDSSMGKSTLQELLELLLEGSLLQSTDATEAGLRQLLDYDTLPVALDEFESEEDNRRQLAIVKLARTASSGGKGVRGGQDHKGHEFIARSCFLFSSILLPPLLQQDRNRLAILELQRLDRRAKPPVLAPKQLRQWGGDFRRRMVDQWPRFARTLEQYRRALGEVGHNGRSADQFGTLLACADMLLWEYDAPDDHVTDYAAQLDARRLAEKAEDASDSERCARHLASSIAPPLSGETPADVATWCLRALHSDDHARAKLRLAAIGLRVVQVKPKPPGADGEPGWSIRDPAVPEQGRLLGPEDELYLAVVSNHVGLSPLFRGSHWQARPGAASAWAQTLRRLEATTSTGARMAAIANQKLRVGGGMTPATLVPLCAIADVADIGRDDDEPGEDGT